MKSIAFFNNKGGVGKTTLLCNVAAYLALEMNKKILVVDADPQCNATQLMLDEQSVFEIYDKGKAFTIHSIIHPLSMGRGYSEELKTLQVPDYGVELLVGDPRLALKEDLLSKDWQDATAGDIRGLRTSFLFSDLISRCKKFDLVLFDMGPSLGSINRSVLLSCDFFLSPMSIDIFSLKAIENISSALQEWKVRLAHGLAVAGEELPAEVPAARNFEIMFAGYVAQQYIQRATGGGEKRAVDAYEKVMKKIPKTIKNYFIEKFQPSKTGISYEIGRIPNLYSLIPMSQVARKPVFGLRAGDGVRGAHFNKVSDARKIYQKVAGQLISNLEELSK